MNPPERADGDPSATPAATHGGEASKVENVYPIATGVPLGAIIPRKLVESDHFPLLTQPSSAAAERFRRLRVNLDNTGQGSGLKQVIVVTSSVPEEGKTTVSVNLALAMAEDKDKRILLLDADLRRPAVGSQIHPKPMLGLSEVLNGSSTLDHALLELKNGRISVLPAGTPSAKPLELLGSGYLETLLEELRRRYERVIIDTPPTVPFTDASVLGGLADGVVLVVRAGVTPKPLVRKAMESLSGCDLLGVVLNGVQATPVDRYYYRYDDYNPDRYYRSREQ